MRLPIDLRNVTFIARSDLVAVLDMGHRPRADQATGELRRQGARLGTETGGPSTGRTSRLAHAYRDGEMVCGRVELIVRADTRLGLTPRERRCLTARFVEHLHPALRTELAALVRRRGAVARRAAERMQPIELVFGDPHLGLQRIIGSVQPPQRRNSDLHDIEFGVHEPAT